MYNIILASGSPRRKEIFEQVGIKFNVISSNKEEIITKSNPSEVVIELAEMKARDVAEQITEPSIIIGADTIVCMNDQIMGKPMNEEDAKAMLRILQGNKHQVYTGVSVIIQELDKKLNSNDKVINFYESTEVWVNFMTEEQISAYVATGEPYDKAGAYGIQGLFAINIGGIAGDYYNIVGFPISKLYTELLKEGIDLLNP